MGAAVVGFSSCALDCTIGRPRWKSSIGSRSPSEVLGLGVTSEAERLGFALGGANGGGVGVLLRLPDAVAELPEPSKISSVTSLKGSLPFRTNGGELGGELLVATAALESTIRASAGPRGDGGGV